MYNGVLPPKKEVYGVSDNINHNTYVMNTPFYSYALDKNCNLISIENASKGNEYFCINCGAVMITKLGDIRRHHFAHKANIHKCSYETYLHKLAKFRIAECFNSAAHFNIILQTSSTCSIENCPVGSKEQCQWSSSKEVDLIKDENCCDQAA